jgi:hypothetical protein
MKNVVVGLLALICAATVSNAAPVPSVNSHTIKSIEVDPAVACFGEEVQVTIQVVLYGSSEDVQKWGSTSIDGVCFEHEDYQSDDGQITFSEDVVFIAPGTQGQGNVQVKTFELDGCSDLAKTENVDVDFIFCSGDDGGDGEDGINCWDLNENGEADFPDEDVNSDEFINVLDCQGQDGTDGTDGQGCTIDSVLGGVKICCGEVCLTLYDGIDGTDGTAGTDGSDGRDGRNGSDGSDGADGEDGADGRDGQDGKDGVDGQNGVDGRDGVDGESCKVIDNFDATCTVVCTDSKVMIHDCGIGADPEEDIFTLDGDVDETPPETGPTPCGTFGGITVIAMLLPLGLMRCRLRKYGV